jgi:hypothetical protein
LKYPLTGEVSESDVTAVTKINLMINIGDEGVIMELSICGVAGCASPTGNRICRTHRDALRKVLAELRTLPLEVELTMTRQSRTGGAQVGSIGDFGRERPMPFDGFSSDVLGELRAVLGCWSGEVTAAHPHLRRTGELRTAASVAETAGKLLNVLGLFAGLPEAPRGLRELSAVADRARAVIDRRGDRVYLGICSAETADGECPEDLYALVERHQVTCRSCGATWGVSERRDWLRRALQDAEATAKDIAAGAGEISGVVLNVKTIRSWAAKELVETVGYTEEGVALHKVGEVLEYAEGVDERKRMRGFLRKIETDVAQIAESA